MTLSRKYQALSESYDSLNIEYNKAIMELQNLREEVKAKDDLITTLQNQSQPSRCENEDISGLKAMICDLSSKVSCFCSVCKDYSSPMISN